MKGNFLIIYCYLLSVPTTETPGKDMDDIMNSTMKDFFYNLDRYGQNRSDIIQVKSIKDQNTG